MDLADNVEFRNRLVTLAELFDLKLAATRQALYFEALRDLPFERIAHALNQAARHCKFFPKPAELRVLAEGDAEDAAETAWMGLRQAMRIAGAYASLAVADAALGETIVRLFGSWPAACALDLSPEMWASKRKEFGRVYRVLRSRNLAGARFLPGVCETENAGRPEWLTYVPVHRLESGDVAPLTLADAEQARTLMAAQAHGFQQISDGEDPPLNPMARDDSA